MIHAVCEKDILICAEADAVVAAEADPGLCSETVSSLPQLPTAGPRRNSPLCGWQEED